MNRSVLCVSALALSAVPALASDYLASWDFNDSDLMADFGTGFLTTDFSSTSFVAGVTTNARPTVVAGNALNLQSSANNGRSFVLQVDATGYEDLIISFAWRRNNNGFNSNHVSWSTDGTNFTNVASSLTPPQNAYGVQSINFASLSAVDNAATLFVRVQLNGANNNGGNNQLDNVQVEATPLAVPAPAAMGLLLGGLAVARRRRR